MEYAEVPSSYCPHPYDKLIATRTQPSESPVAWLNEQATKYEWFTAKFGPAIEEFTNTKERLFVQYMAVKIEGLGYYSQEIKDTNIKSGKKRGAEKLVTQILCGQFSPCFSRISTNFGRRHQKNPFY
jgi:hypothetical protein